MRILLLVMTLLPGLVAADIYRWTDAEGNVIFSDSPQPGAEEISVDTTNVVPAQAVFPDIEPDQSAPTAKPYSKVFIESPANEATIRDNVGNIAVVVGSEPPLQGAFGHTVELFFDGKSFEDPGDGTQFQLKGVERGAHTLEAVIRHGKGVVIGRSPLSTFFLHKISVLNRAR